MSNLIKGIVILVFLSVSHVGFAKTSDGETPSVETICDVYHGASSGAFGLCNAYCEAMDCGDPFQNASNRGCASVNKNFEKRFGVRLPEGYNYDDNGQLIGNNCMIGGGDDDDDSGCGNDGQDPCTGEGS